MPRVSKLEGRAMMAMARLALCLGIASLASIWLLAARAVDAAKTPDGRSAAQGEQAKKLLDAVKEYEEFGRVDDDYRWAPELCRMPIPGRAKFSASGDADTHGKKLYSLFAKDRLAYVKHNADAKPMAVGQIIVKESWIPEEVKSDANPGMIVKDLRKKKDMKIPPFGDYDHFLPYASKDGKMFKASKKADLFVMMKVDPKTPETDAGWVYGTIDADAKTVTAIGKIASCMECHAKAKNDRLFGLNAK
jgi:Cytochrome P460